MLAGRQAAAIIIIIFLPFFLSSARFVSASLAAGNTPG
jgi:hypothetical protein